MRLDWPRERLATTLLAGAAIAVILVLLGLGVRGTGTGAGGERPAAVVERPCGAATDAVARTTMTVVARRLRDEEHAGSTVDRARRSIQADRALSAAVARGDAVVARRQALVLLFNHEHIVRLRVLRGRRPLADVGGKLVLTPVFATLRSDGRVVGAVEFSVQDDMGYRLLTQRLVGIATVMRYRGRIVMANIDTGGRRLPETGFARIGGVRYLIATLVTGHFPTGQLRISLVIPAPAPALAREGCAQVRADLLRDIARRVYRESITGPAAVIGRAAVRTSLVLPAALAAGQGPRARASARRLLRAGHLARLAVVSGTGHVVADVGISEPTIAPVALALRRHGAFVGTALLAVQSANGFVGVSSYLTSSDILVRNGSGQLAGRVAGPASLPPRGPLVWHGRRYHVATFAGRAFPSGDVTVYALVPDAAQP